DPLSKGGQAARASRTPRESRLSGCLRPIWVCTEQRLVPAGRAPAALRRSNRRRDHRNVRIKQPDYKVAYVQLAHGQTFTFPDLFPKGKRPGGSSVDEDLQDQVLEEQRRRQSPDPRRGGVPGWFGL
uniref:Uncharacterized protein n=1 Tax=Ovis aries TaxID=9940 RepID=A0AC11E6L9_SHEEP